MTDPQRPAEIAIEQLDIARAIDANLCDGSPMSASALKAGHMNMQSVIMVAQVQATLELAEQLERIADALAGRRA